MRYRTIETLTPRHWQAPVTFFVSIPAVRRISFQTVFLVVGVVFGAQWPLVHAMSPVERLPPPTRSVRTLVTPEPSRSTIASTPFALGNAAAEMPEGNLHAIQSGIGMPGLNTPLSLVDLEAIAFAHNPTLAQSAADVNGANGRILQATLAPNPIAGYQGQEIGNEGAIG